MRKGHRPYAFAFMVLFTVTLACGQGGTTPELVATQPPVPTSAPLPTPTPTPLPPGPCENVLYPLVPGNQWIYQINPAEGESSKVGLTVEKVENSQATVNALDMSTGVVTQTTVECLDGAIQNYPAMTLNMILGDTLAGVAGLDYVSGVFAPAESGFSAVDWGLSWQGDYIVIGNVQIQDEEDGMTIVIEQSPVHLAWQTAGTGDAAFESVTVQAGTFERALKVTRGAAIDASLVVEGMSVKGTLVIHTTHWFEPHVGMVRMQIDGGEVTYMGLTFPIQVQGTVELVEFRPAN